MRWILKRNLIIVGFAVKRFILPETQHAQEITSAVQYSMNRGRLPVERIKHEVCKGSDGEKQKIRFDSKPLSRAHTNLRTAFNSS